MSVQCSNVSVKGRKKGESSLQDVKRRGRMERRRDEEEDLDNSLKMLVRLLSYPSRNLLDTHSQMCVCAQNLSSRPSASGTGLVFSEIFTHHVNLWDSR